MSVQKRPSEIPLMMSGIVFNMISSIFPAAHYQIRRLLPARWLSDETVNTLVNQYTKARPFGFPGKPAVKVLGLNLALDGSK